MPRPVRRMIAALTLCVLAVFGLAACEIQDDTAQAPEGQVTVVVDVPSVRGKPEVVLSESASERVREVIDELTFVDGEAPDVGGLGFRGFVISDGEQTWRVTHDQVIDGPADVDEGDPVQIAESSELFQIIAEILEEEGREFGEGVWEDIWGD